MPGVDLLALLLAVAALAVGFAVGLLVAQSRGLTASALDARERRLLDLADSRFREAGARASGELESR